jgi:sodium-dependent dicarboxylate transporter 2/3/5
MSEEPVDAEPYDTVKLRHVRFWVLPLVILAGVLGALIAPADWQRGPGTIELRYDNAIVVSVPVAVGSDAPVQVDESAGSLRFQLSLPGGVPVDSRIDAELRVADAAGPLMPDPAQFELKLVLADGSRESIPILRWDDSAAALVAERRPPRDSAVVLGLLAVVVVLWISEAVPLFVTSLTIPVVLAVAGVASASDSLAPFFHPIIALFFGGFLMAQAMRRVRLDHLAAIQLVARFGRSPVTLFAAMLGVSSFLSMWMSNTAAMAVLLPIVLAVTEPLKNAAYRRVMVLGIAYAATIGGVGSAIGTPANPLAIEFLSDFAGRDTTFIGWFPFGVPMVLLFLPLMGVYLWWRMGVHVDARTFAAARAVARSQMVEIGGVDGKQLTVLAVFVGVVALWLTQTWHSVDTGIIALGGALALFALRRLESTDLGRISWPSLLTFGGGLTLGLFLVETGSADWIATRFESLEGLPTFLAVGVVAVLALAMSTVASNTASAAVLIPLAIPLAGIFGVDPVLLVVTIAIASSVDFALVIGTPPTMLAYSTGLFTAPQILRIGIVLDLVGILLLVTAVRGIWSLLGVV